MKGLKLYLFIIALIVMCCACGAKEKKAETEPEPEEYATAAPDAEDQEFYHSDEDTFIIKTKYCDLKYPVKWQGSVDVQIIEDGEYKVTFCRKTENAEVHLFDLCFETGDGYKLGTLTLENGTVDIYIDSFDIDQSTMSEEEYYECCAMSEDVNVIISKLIDEYGMQLN